MLKAFMVHPDEVSLKLLSHTAIEAAHEIRSGSYDDMFSEEFLREVLYTIQESPFSTAEHKKIIFDSFRPFRSDDIKINSYIEALEKIGAGPNRNLTAAAVIFRGAAKQQAEPESTQRVSGHGDYIMIGDVKPGEGEGTRC